MGNFPKCVEKSPFIFCIFTIIIHCFAEAEKRLSGTQNAKTPHIYPILLEQMARVFARMVRGILF